MSDALVMLLICLALVNGGGEALARGLGRSSFGPRWSVLLNGFCQSAPLLALSLAAAANGYPRAAVAIMIGGHLANVGLALSLATLSRPLTGSKRSLRTAVPLLVAATLLAWLLARDNALSLLDGIVLLAAGIAVFAILLRREPTVPQTIHVSGTNLLLALAGAGWLIGAAILLVRMTLEESVNLAGIGGIVFGLTALAPGASIRAIIAISAAARANHGDQVFASVIGGSLINLLFGLGLIAVIGDVPIPDRMLYDAFPAALVATLFVFAIFINDFRTRRWEALLQLAAYGGFVAWLLPRG